MKINFYLINYKTQDQLMIMENGDKIMKNNKIYNRWSELMEIDIAEILIF
jgi:hypothetical protein